jgi:amidase
MVLETTQERHATSNTDGDQYISAPTGGDFSPGSYTSRLSKKDALRGARFGLPWKRVWEAASTDIEKGPDY